MNFANIKSSVGSVLLFKKGNLYFTQAVSLNFSTYLLCYLYLCFFKSSVAPSSPSQPVVSDITAHTATLTWDAPSDDGGNAISGYVIEKRDSISKRWVPIAKTDGTSVTVEGLMEGSEYAFRVAAQNQAGVGQFSQATVPIVAKEPYGKYTKLIQIFTYVIY